MSLKIDRPDSPAGQMQKPSPVKIDYDLCEAAGTCEMVCPEDVLEHKDGFTRVIDGQACTECWICVDNCASQAISVG